MQWRTSLLFCRLLSPFFGLSVPVILPEFTLDVRKCTCVGGDRPGAGADSAMPTGCKCEKCVCNGCEAPLGR